MTKKRTILLALPVLLIDIVALQKYIWAWYLPVFGIMALSELSGAMIINKYVNPSEKLFRNNSKNFLLINISCYCVYRLIMFILNGFVYIVGCAVYRLPFNIFDTWDSMGFMYYSGGLLGGIMMNEYPANKFVYSLPEPMRTGIISSFIIAVALVFIYGYISYKKYLAQINPPNKNRIINIICNTVLCAGFAIFTFIFFYITFPTGASF